MQAMQCIADLWCCPIRSTVIIVVITFLNLHLDLLSTDKERQEWATWYLQDLCFAYKESDGDDKNVCACDCAIKH